MQGYLFPTEAFGFCRGLLFCGRLPYLRKVLVSTEKRSFSTEVSGFVRKPFFERKMLFCTVTTCRLPGCTIQSVRFI